MWGLVTYSSSSISRSSSEGGCLRWVRVGPSPEKVGKCEVGEGDSGGAIVLGPFHSTWCSITTTEDTSTPPYAMYSRSVQLRIPSDLFKKGRWMNGNLGCQLEWRSRPLKPTTKHEHSMHPETQHMTLRYLEVLTTHDCDVFRLEDRLDDSLPVVCRLRSRA